MLKNPKIRMAVVGLLIVVVGYMFVLPKMQGGSAAAPAIPEHPNPGPTYTVAAKVYNLLTPTAQQPRYLKLGVVLEFEATEPAFVLLEGEALQAALDLFAEELGPKAPLIDDAVGTIISRRSLDDAASALGREQLKAELKETIAEIVGEPLLLSVYFTEFVYQ